MNLLNQLNFKFFFYWVIPISTLSLAAVTNFFYLELPTKDSISLMFSQLIAPYLTGGIWIFLYSKVGEVFIDGRTQKIEKSNPADTLFRFNEPYMNLSNYMIFVFAAWILFTGL